MGLRSRQITLGGGISRVAVSRGLLGVAAPWTITAFSGGPFASTGWQVSILSPTDLPMTPITVTRQGFDGSGNAVTYDDTVLVIKRVRQPYPNHALFDANLVALSEPVYVNDVVFGCVNNSTETSPKPVAQWVMLSRLLVGNSVHLEVVAAHRDARQGRQVAAVQFRAVSLVDGTTTSWQSVSAPTVSTHCEDANPVEAYVADHNIAALPTGDFYVEAKVYPWFGGASSVRSTSDYSASRDFSKRYFRKDVARAANPPIAVVNATSGNNATAVISTNSATATASPFVDVNAAINAIYGSGAGVTGGYCDGVQFWLTDGTYTLSTGFTGTEKRPQLNAALVLKRHPTGSTGRSAVIVQPSASTTGWQPNLGIVSAGGAVSLTSPLTECAVILEDLTYMRGTTGTLRSTNQAGTTCDIFVQWHNVIHDFNSQTTPTLQGSTAHDAVFGMVATNVGGLAAAVFSLSGTSERRLYRGLVCADAKVNVWEAHTVVGCNLTNAGKAAWQNVDNGVFVYASRFYSLTTGWITFESTMGVPCDRVAIVQNLAEPIATNTAYGGLIIGGVSTSTVGAVVHHNTVLGAGAVGRANLFYDNQDGSSAGASEQTHKHASVKGNYWPQQNSKNDRFTLTAGYLNFGNWEYTHGCGVAGNYTMFAANSPTTENPDYFGIGSVQNLASSTVPLVAESTIFTNYRATTMVAGVATAGLGGGTYTVVPGSPTIGLLNQLLLGKDLAGNSRVGAQAAGCYAS